MKKKNIENYIWNFIFDWLFGDGVSNDCESVEYISAVKVDYEL